ncbi:SDR family oxidoreductase [Pseudomonas sp. PICF141]|uniref:SDR family oxidoreductase n=1 Tax=Pseudomonas sp. PICF141 TaxID=1949067 RepID=UPI000BABCEE4|nr:SDR family oxidoreductase [Pseudomonas sp. PICF141]
MMQRTFLITGASKGIGRAISERLASAGHRVVGIARRVEDSGFPGELIAADLRDCDSTVQTLEGLKARYTFDGLVNNVGLVKPQGIAEVDLTSFEDVMKLNLYPALLATQALLPDMSARRWGRIVNISSLTVLGVRQRTSYAAAKAALISFTRGWALELAQSGITVNAIAPGPVDTDLFRSANPEGSPGEAAYVAAVPMGRLGQPHEIAAAATFLLDEHSSFITGQTLYVDGGASIGRSLI